MALESDSVVHIAHLARLHLADDDLDRFTGELSNILSFIEQMNAVDTDDVVPMAHPLDMSQPLRADVISEQDRREEYQENAPAVRDGLYLVPKVIE